MNPFVYPKTRHVRKLSPTNYISYKSYKPFLRDEFERKCVYCRMPDTMRGQQGYGADHYRPKKYFPALSTTYSNLFYCCNPCNSRKRSYWADDKPASSLFIPNPCDHEMFRHLRFKSAIVETKSPQGKFTEDFLDLNEPDVVRYREFILQTMDTLEIQKKELQTLAIKIRGKRDAGTVLKTDADAALVKIDANLSTVEAHLTILTGDK